MDPRRGFAFLLGILLVTVTFAPAAASSERLSNEQFVEQHLDEGYDPTATVPVEIDGELEPMPARDAVDLLLETADRVRLAALAQPASGDVPLVEAGDLLIHALFGACGETTEIQETPVPGLQPDPQLWVYEGGLIQGTSSADAAYVNHAAKTEGSAAGTAFVGHGTSLCIPLIGWPGDIWLVVIDGALYDDELVPAAA